MGRIQVLAWVGWAVLCSGCITNRAHDPVLNMEAAPDPLRSDSAATAALTTAPGSGVELFAHLTDTVAVEDPQLLIRLERLELSLLERETENTELRRKLTATQQDVVRLMARLQQVATRAEAASALAEAEVSIRALPTGMPESAEARRWLDLAKTEFDRGNYGGATYLGSQARNGARALSSRLATRESGQTSENQVFFLVPINLTTLAQATVRHGPGLHTPPRFVLEPGSPVRGYSYADRWVYIRDDGGRSGWIAYSQLGRP